MNIGTMRYGGVKMDVHECGQRYIYVYEVWHHVMPGVGGRVSIQDKYNGRNHDNMYSAEDCGISIVMIIFLSLFPVLRIANCHFHLQQVIMLGLV